MREAKKDRIERGLEMIRRVLVAATAVALALLGAQVAKAQFCIDFIHFCDGLELYVDGTSITGLWLNPIECGGEDFAVVGVIRDGIENPCGPDLGWLGVACDKRFGCEIVGDEWYWVLDAERNHWDLGHSEGGVLPPPGACWIDNVQYEVLLGPCPVSADGPEQSLFSTMQAGR